jgi:hypothetical protein
MHLCCRATTHALVSLVAILLLTISTAMNSVALAATALVMGGTGHSLDISRDTQQFVRDYVGGALSSFLEKSGLCSGGNAGCSLVAVSTPEQFRFNTGLWDLTFDESVAAGQATLDSCMRSGNCAAASAPFTSTTDHFLDDTTYVVYGYSQSSTIATLQKRHLMADPIPGVNVHFVVTANPNRPNGGFLQRFAGLRLDALGVTFTGATPTNSDDLTTVDITRQYDGWSDFPTNPLNLLADINAVMGILLLHPFYYDVGAQVPQGQYGDTSYFLIPTPVLPMLMPLAAVPVIGMPLALTLDPVLRVLVEAGYNRTTSPGDPTTAQWQYFQPLTKVMENVNTAIRTGVDNGISYFTGTRPLGTQVPGPYGVGGPPVTAACTGSGCGGEATPAAATPVRLEDQLKPTARTRQGKPAVTVPAFTQAAPQPGAPTTRPSTASRPPAPGDDAGDSGKLNATPKPRPGAAAASTAASSGASGSVAK